MARPHRAERPNLTAAAERGLAAGQTTLVARLSWALWMYWWLRGHHAHGRRLAEAALAHDLPDDVRPRAELAAATMSFAMDDIPASRRWWLQAEEHALVGSDLLAQANSTAGVGLAALAMGELAAAREYFDRASPLAERAGPPGDWTAGLTHVWTGTVALLPGDLDGAAAHIERGLDSANRRGDRLTMYVARFNLSQVELARGNHAEARHHLDAGMRLSLKTGDHANLAYFLDAMAVLEAAEGNHSRVPLLHGAAQGIREVVGARGYGFTGLTRRQRPQRSPRRRPTWVPTATTTPSTWVGDSAPRRRSRSPSASRPPSADADPYTSRTPRAVCGGGKPRPEGWDRGTGPGAVSLTSGVPP